jgi:hypothetical protein
VAGKWTIETFTELKTLILNVGESPEPNGADGGR